MNRRTFLFSAIAIFSIPAWTHFFEFFNYDPLRTPSTLLKICTENEIHIIGKEFLNINSLSASEIREILVNSLKYNKEIQHKQELYKAINRQIQKDFKTKNTITLNGWLISRTEALQCALFTQ